MIYTDMQPSIGLTSYWRCIYGVRNGRLEWYIYSGPTEANGKITFSIDLPSGSVIKRAWLSMSLSSPLTGSAVRTVNGIHIPSDGIVELEGLQPETATFDADFAFRANGAVYQNIDLHESRLTISEPTLYIEYDAPGEDSPPEDDDPVISSPFDSGIQLPRLLNDHYRETARLEPINLRLKLMLQPLSSAVLRAPADGPSIKPRQFVELFNPHGSVGLFRVTEVESAYGHRGERTAYLDHALCTLADSLALGTQAISGPVATVISTLLEGQTEPLWVLGDCDVPPEYEMVYEYSYQNLLQAIIGVTELLPGEYAWVTDTTKLPFVMHLRLMPEQDSCECRMHRNLTTARLTVDTSELCTRVYPFGAGEGTDRVTLTSLTGQQYMDSPNADTWGLVSRTFASSDIYDALTLRDVAQRYLDRHGHPMTSVTMDAMDLSKATGESLDRFDLGRRCRLALPEWGVTMHERVVAMEWPDVYGDPERVDVTLANRIRNASDEIAQLMREATNSKLLGGSVSTVEKFARAGSITPVSPYQITFEVTGYGNVLNVKAVYSCVTSDGEQRTCTVLVDGTEVPSGDTTTVDITRYLAKDENGVPIMGEHKVVLRPNTLNTVTSDVECTVTIKQIEKR